MRETEIASGQRQGAGDSPPLESTLPPLVFVHGLKGGHLRRKRGGRKYLALGRLLCGGCCGLDQMPLPRQYEADSQESDDLLPDGPIADVRLLGLKVLSMYAPLFEWAAKSGRRLYAFSYDWRRDQLEAGQKLERFLEELLQKECRAGIWSGGAQLMCHSNGGIVTFPVVRRRPELFHSMLWAASGSLANVSMLPDLSVKKHSNNMLGGNGTMMTPDRWLDWPSGFHFLPTVKEQAESEALFGGAFALCEADGAKVEVDFHDIESYRRLKLGPFHPRSGVSLPLSDADEAFLVETLRRARAFRELMVRDPSFIYPPMAVIAASNSVTPVGWKRPSPEAPFNFGDGDADVLNAPGDGRFAFSSAGPPEGVPVALRIVSDASHSGVAVDLINVEKALDALLRA